MSRGTLYVRLPDGTVRYGIYNGTCDMALPHLYDTPDEAWDAWREGRMSGWDGFLVGEGDRVLVATDYGGEYVWHGTATYDRLTSGYEPDPIDDKLPLPDWARYPKEST